MRMKYASLLATVIVISSGRRYGGRDSTLRASEDFDLSTALAVSDDAPTESRLTGRVTLSGPAPTDSIIKMAADPVCAKLHPKPALTEEIVLGPEDALANVLVYVSEGLDNPTFDVPEQPAVLEQKGCLYSPHVIALMAGQKFIVENSDPTTHNIHPLPKNNREWNKAQVQGVPPIEATFGREEIAIPVKCNIHPWMKGYIAVFKHPYFALTGKDGAFVLKDLPPGTYTITAWHEKLGALTQRVTVGSNEEKELQFIFKSHSGN